MGEEANGPSRIESAFLIFLILAAASILNGFFAGTLDKPLVSVLYLVKWFEYFLVFAFTLRLTRTPQDVRFFLTHFFFLGLALALYGYVEHFYPSGAAVYPNYYRLYERPPFHGDANHAGGLLAIWMVFFSTIYLRSDGQEGIDAGSSRSHPELGSAEGGSGGRERRRASAAGADEPPVPKTIAFLSAYDAKLLLLAILFVFFPLIWTFSRKSYFALGGALAFAFFIPGINRRRWLFLVCLLISAGLLLPTRLAARLMDLGEVLRGTDPYHSSWSGNLDVWGRCFWNFKDFWLWGPGFGARHRLFYESQYVMTLTETGVAGFCAFLLLLLIPARLAFKKLKEGNEKGLIAGAWLVAWAALGIHGLSCVSLTVSKVAVPWWFLTGCVFGFLTRTEEAV